MLYIPQVTESERFATEIQSQFRERVNEARDKHLDAIRDLARRRYDADKALQEAMFRNALWKTELLYNLRKREDMDA